MVNNSIVQSSFDSSSSIKTSVSARSSNLTSRVFPHSVSIAASSPFRSSITVSNTSSKTTISQKSIPV